jgi:hypothetical protein
MKNLILLLLCFTFISVFSQHPKKLKPYKTTSKTLVTNKDSTVWQRVSKDTVYQTGKPDIIGKDTGIVYKFQHNKPKGIK